MTYTPIFRHSPLPPSQAGRLFLSLSSLRTDHVPCTPNSFHSFHARPPSRASRPAPQITTHLTAASCTPHSAIIRQPDTPRSPGVVLCARHVSHVTLSASLSSPRCQACAVPPSSVRLPDAARLQQPPLFRASQQNIMSRCKRSVCLSIAGPCSSRDLLRPSRGLRAAPALTGPLLAMNLSLQ